MADLISYTGVALLFTLVTIIDTVIVLLPGLVANFPQDLFLITADTSALEPSLVTQLHVNTPAAELLAWGDYVYVGLWNSCMGHVDKAVSGESIKCTSPSISFVFDPVSVWSLNGSSTEPASIVLPPALVNALESHSVHTVWIKVLLIIALALGVVGWTAGIIGACMSRKIRRRRMFLTAAVAGVVEAVLLLIGSSLATHAYTALLDALNPSFGDVITFSLGRTAIALLWLSVLFASLTVLFWVVTVRRAKTPSSHGRRFGSDPSGNRRRGTYISLPGNVSTTGQNNEHDYLSEKITTTPPIGKYEPYKHKDMP